eukprot:1161045-Pelagomonas_calceolata.AAC.11
MLTHVLRVLAQVQHRMQTVRAELYNGYEDDVRFAFEIILSIWVYSAMLYNFWEIAKCQKEQGNFMKVCEAEAEGGAKLRTRRWTA